MDSITTNDGRFVDGFGRQRIFHGINLVFKGERLADGRMNYIPPWGERDIAALAARGFNVARLGLIWDGLEPALGEYNDGYLDWAARMLDLCAAHGIHVFLDMHQDLFSVLYGDGAPAWATLAANETHVGTDLWSDAYLFSPAVQQSLDSFWRNDPAPDGVGLMDHYAALWRHIVRRLGDHPALIGCDFMNEPNPGSPSAEIFGGLMAGFAGLLGQREGREIDPEEIVAAFTDPMKKLEMLGMLEDKSFYLQLAAMSQGSVAAFDRGALDRFYNKMTAALREVTARGIVFRENSYFSNIGIRCEAQPVQGPSGLERQMAYSPHGYDLVVDTEAIGQASNARVDVIFTQHRQTQKALGVPVLVGEWGAFHMSPDVLGHAGHLLNLFEGWQWSDTYWCYHENFFAEPVLDVLHRSYPQAVAGEIVRYHCDTAAHSFAMEWQDDGACAAPTVIYLHREPVRISLAGSFRLEGSRLVIPAAGGLRSLHIAY